MMIPELVLYRICEICHYSKNVFKDERFDEVFGLLPGCRFTLAVLLLLKLEVTFDIV